MVSGFEEYDGPGAGRLVHELWPVYDAVFGDVADAATWQAQTLDPHRARPDFRLVLARQQDRPVGFAYGYTGHRGEWWPDRAADALGEELARQWVGGHFEFVELAVIEDCRRRGIGLALHDRLLAGLPHERALLSTDRAPTTPARRLYARRGWIPLGDLGPDTAILGRRLATAS